MDSIPRDAALLVIDVQRGFDDPALGRRTNPGAEGNVARLLAAWRRAGRLVIHVRHHSREPGSPLRPGQPGAEIKDEARPLGGAPVVTKHVNSAFIGTDLEGYLRDRGIAALVIAGLTTDHCVSTTARMAANLGFHTWVVGHATATFERAGPDGRAYPAELVQALALASLHGEFATVVDTEMVVRQAGQSAGTSGSSRPSQPTPSES